MCVRRYCCCCCYCRALPSLFGYHLLFIKFTISLVSELTQRAFGPAQPLGVWLWFARRCFRLDKFIYIRRRRVKAEQILRDAFSFFFFWFFFLGTMNIVLGWGCACFAKRFWGFWFGECPARWANDGKGSGTCCFHIKIRIIKWKFVHQSYGFWITRQISNGKVMKF